MAANFPGSYDTIANLGGPFIDVAPPVDLQRDIAAEYRNVARDSIVAIEERLGYLGVTDDATVDWGLLTVGGAPNQGLRFAGVHADWPGDITEGGIFLKDTTGNPNFHKAGDPVGTYTDLTTGGGAVSDWDDLYAAAQTMAINGVPLVWTHSTVVPGFVLERNVPLSTIPPGIAAFQLEDVGLDDGGPAAPMMWIKNGNAVVEGPNSLDTTISTLSVFRPNDGLIAQLFEGDSGAPSSRFEFDKTGSLVLKTSAAGVNPAVEVNQFSATSPFLKLNNPLGHQKALWEVSGRLLMEAGVAGQAAIEITQSNATGGFIGGQGSVTGGSFVITEDGRLQLESYSTGIRIDEKVDGEAFIDFVGIEGAGGTHTVSTDSDPVAKMLRVQVDVGAGTFAKWIAAYDSPTLPSVSGATLQTAYNAGNTIALIPARDIDIAGDAYFYFRPSATKSMWVDGTTTPHSQEVFRVDSDLASGVGTATGAAFTISNSASANALYGGCLSSLNGTADHTTPLGVLWCYAGDIRFTGAASATEPSVCAAFYARNGIVVPSSGTGVSCGLAVDSSYDVLIYSQTGLAQIVWKNRTDEFNLTAWDIEEGTTNGLLRIAHKTGHTDCDAVTINSQYGDNTAGSDGLGGRGINIDVNTAAAPYNLLATGRYIGYHILHTHGADDSTAGTTYNFYGNDSIPSSGGNVADLGPNIYSLYLNLPETYVGGKYETNTGAAPQNRYAIWIEQGESHLRITELVGINGTNKPLLTLNQQDGDHQFIFFDGHYDGGNPALANLTTYNGGLGGSNTPMQLPSGGGEYGWRRWGMVKISVVDGSGSERDVWVPAYDLATT